VKCQAEMEQDRSDRAREQAEAWEEVAAEVEWAEIVRDQDRVETVFARIAAIDYSISKECLVIQ